MTGLFRIPATAWGVGGVSLILYLLTLYPGTGGRIEPGDSCKFQFIGHVLGVPHSTGYPVYVLLSSLWGLLPLPLSLAARINALSAVLAAGTNLILFLILRAQVRRVSLALGATALFAVTQTYWAEATEAEVYTLNSLLLALTIWLAVQWEAARSPRILIGMSIVLALSLGNHSSTVAVLPALAYLVARPVRSVPWRPGLIGVALCAVLVVLEYSYIYIRSHQHAPYLEAVGSDATLADLVDSITGGRFRPAAFDVLREGMVGTTFVRLVRLLARELGVPLLALGGIAFLLIRGRVATFLRIILVAELLFIMAVDFKASRIEVLLIPVVLILVLLLARGIDALADRFPPPIAAIVVGGLGAFVIWIFLGNLPTLLLSQSPWEDRVSSIVNAMPEGATVAVHSGADYDLYECLMYYRLGEDYLGPRRIELVNVQGDPGLHEALVLSRHPIYFSNRSRGPFIRLGTDFGPVGDLPAFFVTGRAVPLEFVEIVAVRSESERKLVVRRPGREFSFRGGSPVLAVVDASWQRIKLVRELGGDDPRGRLTRLFELMEERDLLILAVPPSPGLEILSGITHPGPRECPPPCRAEAFYLVVARKGGAEAGVRITPVEEDKVLRLEPSADPGPGREDRSGRWRRG